MLKQIPADLPNYETFLYFGKRYTLAQVIDDLITLDASAFAVAKRLCILFGVQQWWFLPKSENTYCDQMGVDDHKTCELLKVFEMCEFFPKTNERAKRCHQIWRKDEHRDEKTSSFNLRNARKQEIMFFEKNRSSGDQLTCRLCWAFEQKLAKDIEDVHRKKAEFNKRNDSGMVEEMKSFLNDREDVMLRNIDHYGEHFRAEEKNREALENWKKAHNGQVFNSANPESFVRVDKPRDFVSLFYLTSYMSAFFNKRHPRTVAAAAFVLHVIKRLPVENGICPAFLRRKIDEKIKTVR